jgi:hypothetical protein
MDSRFTFSIVVERILRSWEDRECDPGRSGRVVLVHLLLRHRDYLPTSVFSQQSLVGARSNRLTSTYTLVCLLLSLVQLQPTPFRDLCLSS